MNEIRMSQPKRDIKKAREVILYLLERLGPLEENHLHNLLYFIDMDYYERYEEQLIGLEYYK